MDKELTPQGTKTLSEEMIKEIISAKVGYDTALNNMGLPYGYYGQDDAASAIFSIHSKQVEEKDERIKLLETQMITAIQSAKMPETTPIGKKDAKIKSLTAELSLLRGENERYRKALEEISDADLNRPMWAIKQTATTALNKKL